jgi:hypothetical protein
VTLKDEQEYFKLAAVALQCLWHELHVDGDKFWFFLGYMDFITEMSLLLKECKGRPGGIH